MKRLAVLLILPLMMLMLSVSAPVFVSQTSAVDIFQTTCGSGKAANGSVCSDVNSQGTNSNPIIHIIKGAILVISYIVGIAAVIGILVSGFRMVVAGGDANAVASARTGLIYSLIGIAVVALAQLIVVFVINRV